MTGTRGPIGALKLVPGASTQDSTTKTEGKRGPSVAENITASRPEKPKYLPENTSRMWDQIVDDLVDTGLIASFDAATLELALRHYALAVKASNTLMRGTVVKEDKKNQRTMKHPASQVFKDHSAAFLEYAKQMGLTFSARARIQMGEMGNSNDNPFGGA